MRPLLKWPGGKFRKAKVINAILPKHETYVEPFAGGASIFWNKEPAATEVLGDRNDWLIHFYDEVRRGGLRSCQPVRATRENWEKVRRCSSPCCRLATNRLSWQGDMQALEHRDPDGRPVAAHVLAKLPFYEKRLRHAHLRLSDFAATMRRWDSPTTVHYLDPPWVALGRTKSYSRDHYHQNGTGRDLPVEQVAQVAREMQGKVVISYDDSPAARRAFNRAGLLVYKMPTTRSPGGQGTVPTTELLVTNFKLPAVIKLKKK